jgi:hypothetical protein
MSGLAEFFMGFAGGAAQAGADDILMREKEAIAAERDRQLSKLRTQEHATNKASDIAASDKQAADERGRRAEFFKSNKLPDQEIEGQEINPDTGEVIGKIKGEGPADRKDQAEHYARKSLETGDKGLVEIAQKEAKDIREEEAGVRRDRALEAKAITDSERTALAALKIESNERIATARLEAALRAAADKGDKSKDSAKIREAEYVARAMFGYDDKKERNDPANIAALEQAAPYVFGNSDRGPSLADVLKMREQASLEGKPISMEDATRQARDFYSAGAGSRGGVKPPGVAAKNTPAPGSGKPWEKFKKPGGN